MKIGHETLTLHTITRKQGEMYWNCTIKHGTRKPYSEMGIFLAIYKIGDLKDYCHYSRLVFSFKRYEEIVEALLPPL